MGFVVGVVGGVGAMKLVYDASAPPWGVLAFVLGLAAAVVVHELGHLIAGWTVGFHFNSIQVGWFFIGFEYGKLTFKTKYQSNLAGYATIRIDRIRRLRTRLLIFILGGPAANLFGALISAGIVTVFDSENSRIASFASVFALICLMLTFLNLMPFSTRGMRTDGGRIRMLLASRDNTRRWICLMAIGRQWQDGKAPKYWNGNWTKTAASIRDSSYDEYASCWASYIRASGRKDVDVAARCLERCLEISSMLPGNLRDLLFLEASIFTAWFRRDAVRAGRWALQIRNPNSFPKLLWLRGLIALDCAKGDFPSARSEWEQAKRLIERLPRTKYREGLLTAFDEWLMEIKDRERETSSRVQVVGADVQG